MRVTAAGEQCFYSAWINELEKHVIETLATQAELPIILASPLGERVGRGSVPNGLRELALKVARRLSAQSSLWRLAGQLSLLRRRWSIWAWPFSGPRGFL